MISWDSKFTRKMRSLGITTKLYARYVDDVLCVLRPIRKGWYFDKEIRTMTYDIDRARTDTMSNDERMANVLADIANSLEDKIQFTVDFPSRNSNGRMAVLDLEVWVQMLEEGK